MNRLVIGILAHVDAGKTTLSEAILYNCEKLRKMGRVDKKDAFLDNNIMERERGITIFSKQAVFERNGVSFTLIDTPGHADFSAEMERALSVLDVAILVISGTDGIQAHTRTLWKLLRTYDIPTFIFVNKMDRDGCDRAKLQEELASHLSEECIDFSSEDGELSEETLERIALCDEELMESYLESGEVSDESVKELIAERKLFPCYYGSALLSQGVSEFLDGLSRYCPPVIEESEFAARVYKIGRDTEGNRLTYLKVTGGTLKNRDAVKYIGAVHKEILVGRNAEEDKEPEENNSLCEKVTQIRVYDGERYITCDTAEQGMVVAALGLTSTYPGQALGSEMLLDSPELVPVMTYKAVARDKSAIMQLIPKFRILEEEDPSLNVIWNPEVRELQIQVMGEIQLEILKRELLDRFGEDVDFDRGSVLYKETVSEPVLGVGHFEPLRHYAEAQLMLEPAAIGNGITAESRVSTNDLDLNWQRLILTHVLERNHKGVLTGSVLTDVNVVLVAGRAHIKHTEGGDFRQATYRAIRQGLMRARAEGKCVLLEPWYEMSIELPRNACGRAMTDIETRCGKITSQYETGIDDMVGLTALAPVSRMQGYVKEVSAYTKGLGSVYCTFFGYLPCHNSEEIIYNSAYVPEADLRNPASSVFCAHGAGFAVEWNDVDSYKHLDWNPKTGMLRKDNENDQQGAVNFVAHAKEERWIGYEEVDAIIDRMANSNRREKTYRNPFRKHKNELKRLGGAKSGSDYNNGGNNAGRVGKTSIQDAKNRNDKDKYLLVDGYNIIFSWPELNALAAENIDGARERLNEILCDFQALHDYTLIVVYDAYRVAGHPTEYFKHHNIYIVYTKEAETADRFIERFTHENSAKFDITVATSDGLEQIIIRGAGCKLLTALDLLEEVKRTKNETHDRFLNNPSSSIGTRIGTVMPD